ncbi:MAG: ParB/RepB/Spo0J family partition protein [Bacteroidota bacterium]
MAKRLSKTKPSKKDLGSGLDALLSGRKLDKAMADKPEATVNTLSRQFAVLPIAKIGANPDQPRKEFEQGPLQELADSIKVHGIIQPLTVRHMGDGSYQIISGERRFRASQLAGLKEVPAFIRTANDQTLLEMALIENIQRQDLNPMEVAYSYLRLRDEFGLTQAQLADRVGKQRSTVTNYLGILKTSPAVHEAIKTQQISIGAAKAIGGVKDLILQDEFLKDVLAHPSWSVRQIEAKAKEYKKAAIPKDKTTIKTNRDELKMVEKAFKEFFGFPAKVVIDNKKEGSGHVKISFPDKQALHHLFKAVE